MKELKDYVRSIPDFPEPGIIFRDVTSVLQDAEGFKLAIDSMIKLLDGVEFDDLTTEELREFMEHIENCTDCKEELTIEFLVSEGLVRLENGAVFDLQKELSECIAAAERHLHWRENVHMFLYILEGLVAVEAITVAALFVFLK